MEAWQSRQSRALRRGAEAVAGLEARITASGVVRDPSTAEGLALVGRRAASVAAGRPLTGPRTPPILPGSSCLHHAESPPGAVALGAFELVASSAQQAIDLTLAGHLLSQRLARPGLLSLAPELADDLALVRIPDDEAIDACLAEAASAEPVDPHDPERVIALAGECLARVAACTGREVASVWREGPAEASWALVAAGGELDAALAACAALAAAGEPGVLVSPRLVRPFPAGDLAGALGGVRRVFVAEHAAGHGGLRAAVRSALPPRVAVTVVTGADAASLLRSLVTALGPSASRARATQLPEPAPLPHRLLVAPDGPWARQLTRRVLAGLTAEATVRVDRRTRSHLGASVLAWADGSGELDTPAGEDASHRDLLIVAGLSLLEPDGALALMREGGHVLVLADASDERALARKLPKSVRSLLLSRRLHCHWLEPTRDPLPASDEAASAAVPASFDEAAEDTRLLAAASWLATGGRDAALRPAGLATLTPSGIESASATEEVDFRPQSRHLRWPEASADDRLRALWAERLKRFHHGSANGARPVLHPAVQPALLTPLQRELAEDPPHPFVLISRCEDEAKSEVEAHAFGALLDEGLRALEARGRQPRALEHARRALLRESARVLTQAEGGMEVRALLEQAGNRLRQELHLPEADAEAFDEDLAALTETLPEQGRTFALQSDTPLRLYLEVLSAVRAPLRKRFGSELEILRDRLRDLLRLDHLTSEEGRAPEAISAQLGGGASKLLDAGVLARTLPSEPVSGQLEPERRARVAASLAAIEQFLTRDQTRPDVMLLHPPDATLPEAPARTLSHDDPLSAAVGYFDGVARQSAALYRAVRTARLEVAGRYDAEQHDAALAGLDWEGMQSDELALLPPVAVVTTGRRLRRRGQAALSELLRSSRPVHVLVLDEVAVTDEAEDLSLFHLDLGYLVMAHREVFAVSSTLARPDHFVKGLARMVRAPRPGVALVHLPGHELAPLRPLLAEAALLGRACPDFLYDPDAGASWADRFDVDGNPQPDQAWPPRALRAIRDGHGGKPKDTEEHALEVAFTFADAVALEPAYQRHLLAFPPEAWDEERQLPLADWLERLDAGSDANAIPYIWIVDDEGRLQRAAVTRALALASRDRLRGWHLLQELAGFENAHVERASAAAAAAVRAEAERERAELERRHAEVLAQAREQGARASLQQLAEALVRGGAAASLLTASGGTAAATSPSLRPAHVAPSAEAAASTASAPAVTESAPAAADEEPLLDEPYVDSPLCTTCNECTNLNGRLFAYNADKQAYIADASAGTFDELVRAAEKCPARCIHPGSPRSGDATATPELVARATAFR